MSSRWNGHSLRQILSPTTVTVRWRATVHLHAGNCNIGSLGRQVQVVTTKCPPGASVRKTERKIRQKPQKPSSSHCKVEPTTWVRISILSQEDQRQANQDRQETCGCRSKSSSWARSLPDQPRKVEFGDRLRQGLSPVQPASPPPKFKCIAPIDVVVQRDIPKEMANHRTRWLAFFMGQGR